MNDIMTSMERERSGSSAKRGRRRSSEAEEDDRPRRMYASSDDRHRRSNGATNRIHGDREGSGSSKRYNGQRREENTTTRRDRFALASQSRDNGTESARADVSSPGSSSLISRIAPLQHNEKRDVPPKEKTDLSRVQTTEEEDAHVRRIRRLKRRRRSAGLDSDVSEDELLRWSEKVDRALNARQEVEQSRKDDRKRSPTDSERSYGHTSSKTRRREDDIRERRRENDRRDRRVDEVRSPQRSDGSDYSKRRRGNERRFEDDRQDRGTQNDRYRRDTKYSAKAEDLRGERRRREERRERSPQDGSRRADRSPDAILLRRRRSRSLSPARDAKSLPRRRREDEGGEENHRDRLALSVQSEALKAGPERGEKSTSLAERARPDEVYERISQVGEGTYGQVFKARSDRTGVLVALKKIRMESERDGFPITAMREVKLLQGLRHENVVRLHEMMLSKHSIYMVFEYLQHDLNGILAQASIHFTPAHLKSLAAQLLSGLAYLHKHSILHRDLKCSNLLLNNEGTLKLADFGLARSYTKQARAPRQRSLDYTNRVVTLWYRAPELLFGETSYGDAIDIWGAGCIFLELFLRRPAFQGHDEIHQVQLLFALLGPVQKEDWPNAESLPWFDLIQLSAVNEDRSSVAVESRTANPVSHKEHVRHVLGDEVSDDAVDVATALLTYDPAKRLSAQQALDSLPYFSTNEPRPAKPSELLEAVEGEWHEFESRRAKRDAAAQALHAHVNREREEQKEQKQKEQRQEVNTTKEPRVDDTLDARLTGDVLTEDKSDDGGEASA